MENSIFLIVFLGIITARIDAARICGPATLPAGGTWIADQGCSLGGFYRSGTNRCHCWGHCGYICEPDQGSPCPYGGIWYNSRGQKCHCQSLNRQPFYACPSS